MNCGHVWAICVRHLLLMFRDINRILNIFYWPVINIIIYGLMGIWFDASTQSGNYVLIFLAAAVFWENVLLKLMTQIAYNLIDEMFDKNLVNLFTTTLTLTEWMGASILISLINALITFVFSFLVVLLLFKVNLFNIGWYLLPFSLSLILSGIAFGFFLCGLALALGKRSIDLVYYIGWIFSPFCAVYYPLDLLPSWLQIFSKMLPMTYIFEGIRAVLGNGVISNADIYTSFILNIFYLIFSLMFFNYMFTRSKINGLANLD